MHASPIVWYLLALGWVNAAIGYGMSRAWRRIARELFVERFGYEPPVGHLRDIFTVFRQVISKS